MTPSFSSIFFKRVCTHGEIQCFSYVAMWYVLYGMCLQARSQRTGWLAGGGPEEAGPLRDSAGRRLVGREE